MCAKCCVLFLLILGLGKYDFAPMEMSKCMKYLVQFGFMNETDIKNKDQENFKKSLLNFQEFYKIKRSGVLDRSTAKVMSINRCGNPDMKTTLQKAINRTKRFAYYCDKEGYAVKRNVSKILTYKIKNFPYPHIMDKSTTKMQIRRAFSFWMRFVNVTFKETDENEDIVLSFEKSKHDPIEMETDAFDGPGMVLAHAFPPTVGNEIHFDVEEQWTIDRYTGIDLLKVATHEIGHHLGLTHSVDKKSIMYPMPADYNPAFDLHEDDVDGIQNLYSSQFSPFIVDLVCGVTCTCL